MSGCRGGTDSKTIPVFFIIDIPPCLDQSRELLNRSVELAVHIELARKLSPEYADIPHHIKRHDDNDREYRDGQEHLDERETRFPQAFLFFCEYCFFSKNIVQKGGNTSTNLHSRRRSPEALGTDVKNEIHTIEKPIFSERWSLASDDNFDKEYETQEKGNEEISYQNKKNSYGIFFQRSFFHNNKWKDNIILTLQKIKFYYK